MKKITFLFFAILMSALSWQGMAQSGSTCDDPLVVTSMPFNDSGNTSTYGGNYSSSDIPPVASNAVTDGSSHTNYLNGDEAVYSYTAGANGSITIDVTEVVGYSGVLVFTGCPFSSTVGYHTTSSAGSRSIPDLPVMAGETYFIVISTWASPQSTVYTIDITGTDVAGPQTCPKPTSLTTSNFTVNSADVSWTEEGTATSWDIEYGENGFAQGDGTMVTDLTSTSYSITGLDPSSAYQVYVRADCGAGDESFWSGPLNFRTLCDAISNLPNTEDFDTYGTGSDAFPPCWERPVTYTSGSNTWPSIVTRSGTSSTPNALKFQSVEGTPTYAVSPPFAEDIDNLRVSFMLKREGTSSGTIDLGVMSDASDITTFELVATIDPDNNDFIEYVFDLNQVTLSGSDNFIALRHNSNSSIYYYWLDDFTVGLVPTCIEPTGLTASNTTLSQVDVSWTAGDTEASWNVSWGPSGYTPGDTAEIGSEVVAVTDYQLTALTAETAYDVYIQADCGPGDLSYWSGPLAIYTGYCVPTTSNDSAYIESVTLEGDEGQDVSNLNSGLGLTGSGYSDFSSQIVNVTPEGTIEYTIDLESGETGGLKIWIDWNNDLVFDETTELVFESLSYNASYTGSITVPTGVAGDVRMRIGSSYTPSGGPANACSHTGQGEFEDYTISVSGGGGTFPSPYCDVTADSVEEITKVDFDGTVITNTDTTSALIDKIDTIVDLAQGEVYTLKVEGNTHDTATAEFDSNIVAFIDWNQNGILDDAGEVYELGTLSGSTGYDGVFVTMDIEVPADAVLGETRIRITKTYTDLIGDAPMPPSPALINPCAIEFDAFEMGAQSGFGQALDFTLNIEEGDGVDDVACSEENPNDGTFENGFNISSTTSLKTANDVTVAAGEDFTLTNITASIFGNLGITNVDVTYYADASGLPGAVIGSEDAVTIDNQTVIGDNFGYDVNEVEMTVAPFVFSGQAGSATTYWIELSATDGGGTGNVFWTVTSSSSNGYNSAQFDGGWTLDVTGMDGVYIFEGECGPMVPLDDCTGTPNAGVASVDPEQGNINTTYTVSAVDYDNANGLTYQWQSNTDSDGWENEGDLEDHYASYTATASAELGIEVEWRLEITCTFSQETSYSDTATFTTVITYCDADSSIVEPITRVVFAGIDNQSSPTSNEGYEDFTDMVAVVEAGGTYSFAAEGDTSGNYENFFTVWIDWNNNGEFEADEMYEIGSILDSDGVDGQQAVNDILVPEDAVWGETRMRVIKNYGTSDTDPCGTNTFGQVQDYTVNVDGIMGMEDNAITNFTYYPNPMQDVLHITANLDIKSVAVFNVLGQEVLGNKHFTNNKVDVSALPTGTFIFRVTFDNGNIKNFKAVKK